MVNALTREMVNARRAGDQVLRSAGDQVLRSAFALRVLKCCASRENDKAEIYFALARFLSLTINHLPLTIN